MIMKKMIPKQIILIFVLSVGVLLVGSRANAETTLKAEPAAVDYSPKKMAGMKIIGAGFQAEDRVLIVLAGADKGEDVPVASAEADASGSFETRMNILSILQGVFHFRFKKGKPTPDPNNPPIPPGVYMLKATSWDSASEASCNVTFKASKKK
jgi:hypothetical protein